MESLFKIMFIRKNLSIISFHINDVHIIHQQITINKKDSEKSEQLFSFENIYSNDSRRFSLYYIYTTIMIAWLFVYYKDKTLTCTCYSIYLYISNCSGISETDQILHPKDDILFHVRFSMIWNCMNEERNTYTSSLAFDCLLCHKIFFHHFVL